jgi:sec-independent protein translocase protein TatB
MSGIGFFELVILFLIGLIVLGPKRLHSVASQLGSWVGQARRMTRAMKRQLEDELDLGDDLKAVRNIASDIMGIKDDFVDEL